jgi:hypothetical protein
MSGAVAADLHTTRESVPINLLSWGYSPRSHGEDSGHIRSLAEISQAALPPILVHRQTMRVIDGMHRLRAAVLNGSDRIDVEFFDGSDEEAFCRAVELNVSHGLPLSLADRKAAAARILACRSDLSDRAAAAITGLSPKTVGAIRSHSEIPQPHERLGRDGRCRPVNGLAGRTRAAEVIAGRPGASLREIAETAGISVGTARRVRGRLAAGEDVAGVRQPRHTDTDTEAVLRKLRNDPSLKLSAAGRELLRWLHAHTLKEDEMKRVAAAIPPHSVPLMASLARNNAKVWDALASELERRSALGAN